MCSRMSSDWNKVYEGSSKGRRERNLDMKKVRGQEVKGSNASEITNLIRPGLVIIGSKAQLELGARGSTT
jgi:hypothetical protein